MIHVDESDPEGENESQFSARTVKIARGINPEEKYDLIRELGRGKFGTVYRCCEKATGLQLAAKFVGIPNRGDRRNVEREVDIMNTLQHHLITQLYDAFEYQKMMCVVLELIEGGELFDRVIGDDFVLTERACIVFVRQICEALEFVHRNHIVHLDLKPENIMCLTQAGNRIKIIDFGLARKFDPEKKMQILFGTPEFVAPEVVNFDAIGFATDMWSVGVICYVLLSGLSPFMGETDVETMGNVTIAKYDFDDEAFNDISEGALNFITQLLVKEPEKRMTATDALQHQWVLRRPQSERPQLSTITSTTMAIPQVQLISDLSETPPPLDNDLDSSTLSDMDNSESDFAMDAAEEELCSLAPPPPLPKTAPPPIELLMETSLPIIIPTTTPQSISDPAMLDEPQRIRMQANGTELANGIDKELDLTKDNLKTFVERWDGSVPVEIPKTSHGAPVTTSTSAITLKPCSAKPKESSSTSSLASKAAEKSKKRATTATSNNDAGESSDFITPTRNDNDSQPPETGEMMTSSRKQEETPGAAGELQANNVEEDLIKDDLDQPSNSNITKNLLEQLEQIEIKAAVLPATKSEHNARVANGVNYLQVDNNSTTSTPSSTFSSRGCSPSPCESLTSTADTHEQQGDQETLNGNADQHGNESPAEVLRDYLQSFDRRKSDSNYVLGNKNNPSDKEEKMDLVDEIKRLSDHLMMLNTLKTELGEKQKDEKNDKATSPINKSNKQKADVEGTNPVKMPSTPNGSTNGTPKLNGSLERRTSRTKLTDPANLSSKLESKIVKSQIMRFSNSHSVEGGGVESSQMTTTVAQHMSANGTSSLSSSSSVRTATRLIEQLHTPQTPISQPPWMLKCKRTKFRMTELSRDVPQNAPDSHKTVFMEATNTKDCLLQLLEKYNHNAEDEFTKRSLDIDRSVIPSSSSSSSSSIASLPPSGHGDAMKSNKASKISTQSASSCSTNGETVTKTTRTSTRTVTTTESSSSSSSSTTTSATRMMSEQSIDNLMESSELEGKTGAGHTQFAKSIPRHFSLSLNWDKDSLEETSMNSLNTFFQRHSTRVGSSAVKQIQQQMEAKCGPQK